MTRIEGLLEEVRSCTDCEVRCKAMPFAYGSPRADILVVSEGPSETAWRKDMGKKWGEGELFSTEGGVANTLCDWLGIEPERARNRFFWIHRANCYVEKGREYALQHCSSKYIPRALDVVRPRLVIILGRYAAQ